MDETRRLFAEAEERAAELAVVNGVQDGLARRLDMQAMYDLVGDTVFEIFDAQVVDIGIVDHEAGRHPIPVHDRARGPLPGLDDAASSACVARSWSRASRCASTRRGRHGGRGRSAGRHRAARPPTLDLWAPLIARDEADRRASRSRTWTARTPSASRDLRLLTTLASSLERRARECPAVARGPPSARRDGGAGGHRPGDLRDPRPDGGHRAHRGSCPAALPGLVQRASSCRADGRARLPGDHGPGPLARPCSPTPSWRARASSARPSPTDSGSSSTTCWRDPRTVAIPGTEPTPRSG